MTDASPTLLSAFERARISAQNHMSNSEAHELPWGEESITEIVLAAASPFVKVVTFTKPQEGGKAGTGADWLWWWLGDDGESFGTLVQAKRRKSKNKNPWHIDFAYKNGQQLKNLLATAEALQVVPTYILYFGPPNSRIPVECGVSNHPTDFEQCEKCNRKTVSFFPAILANLGIVADDAQEIYTRAIPIEDLADPEVEIESPWVIPNLELGEDLSAFIQEHRQGPRKMAKSLIEQVCRVRFGQFSLAVAEQADINTDDPVFSSLPVDQGHMSTPYFPHILRGLRRTPPGYVLDALAGEPPVGLEDYDIAGLVVVRDSSNRLRSIP